MRNLEETFTYDDMNRLTGITLRRPSGQDLQCAITYDALGRMTLRELVTRSSRAMTASEQRYESLKNKIFHQIVLFFKIICIFAAL